MEVLKKQIRKQKGSEKVYEGIFRGTLKGYGFAQFTEQTRDDAFIPAPHTLGAIDGDEIIFTLTSGEARVVKITKRNTQDVSGILEIRLGEYFVRPLGKKSSVKVFIKQQHLNGASSGDIVLASLLPEKNVNNTLKAKRGSRKPRRAALIQETRAYGKIEKIFGSGESLNANIECILSSHNIRPFFSEDILESAMAASNKDTSEQYGKREDFRSKTIFTIDGADAKDLDDAISVERGENGLYILGVHIADVSYFVRKNSLLDKEAFSRGTSVYYADRVAPMLPEVISNGVCSLHPGVDRFTVSAIIKIDRYGKVISSQFVSSIINSKIKGVYSEINALFSAMDDNTAPDKEIAEKYSEVSHIFTHIRSLAKKLKTRRISRGALELESVESVFSIDYDKSTGEPEVEGVKPALSGESENIIEEFMICANEQAASFLSSLELPCVYRIHESPLYEKMETFTKTVARFGFPGKVLTKKGISSKALQSILSAARTTPYFDIVNSTLLRSLAKARYSSENVGHFGLASEKYCHFTSPIRRYPDLFVHRVIKTAIAGGIENSKTKDLFKLANTVSDTSTAREMNAITVEREIDDLLKCSYMSSKIGEIYTGKISSVTSFGFYVRLENSCGGLVRCAEIDREYNFDSESLEITGGGCVFRPGMEIKIKVAGVSVLARTIDFVLVK